MRTKEDAMDYRYFPDPDLLPVAISDEWIDRVRGEMPELPQAMRERFQTLGLSAYDAAAVTASLEIARYYEGTLKVAGNAQAKVSANWIMGELSARLNREGLDIEAAPVSSEQLGGLIARIADQTISNAIAKKVFDALWQGQGKSADEIIEAQGLKQITDTGAIEALVDEVIAANPGNVAEFKAGKEKALNALVGQIMKAAKGKANPQQVNDLLKKKLG